jgi:hypothetical protein
MKLLRKIWRKGLLECINIQMAKQTVNDQKEKEIPQIPEKRPDIGDESTWSRDQQERSYYYDDGTGYQKYDPDEDEEEDEEEGALKEA